MSWQFRVYRTTRIYMKRIFLITICAILTVSGFSYPVLIQSWHLNEDVKTLNMAGISVDYVNRQSGNIIAYVRNDSEFSQIQALGLAPQKLPDTARENAQRLHSSPKNGSPENEYYSIDQYNQFMVSTANSYPNICQLVQVGSSTQNRPLYFLKITDNPTLQEAEPEFRYISSIHGDEVVGYDMCIRLIQQLTSEYGTNDRITNLVNNTEIWICPMMNPDGFVLGQRYNAAGIDLNRNFPMPSGNQHPDGNPTAIENTAIMNHATSNSFVLSANFHGGALVANYPWDYTYTLTPDNDILIQAALTYTAHNSSMYNSYEFPQGITNGAQWYVITGSMQDWFYGFTDCMDITMEIGLNKWPPANQLPGFWNLNQESMLSYMEFVHKGVSGLVTSSSGAPLSARISVSGNARQINTDPDVGDYHRILLPGTYELTVSSHGYESQTRQITVPPSGSVVENFTLLPAVQVMYNGQVRDYQGNPVPAATLTISTEPPLEVITDQQGLFSAQIFTGSYDVKINAPGHGIYQLTILAESTQGQMGNYRNIIVLQPPVFADDFEQGLGNWTVTGNWGIVFEDGSMVLTDSPNGNYGNNQNRTARLTNPVSLGTVSNPRLHFRCKYFLENGYDFVYVEGSNTGTTWTQLGSFTGTQSSWIDSSFDLASFAGNNFYLRFRISSDYYVNADGIYIDDVRIMGVDSSNLSYGDVTADGVVNITDVRAILDYTVGLDPLTDIDPRPWTAPRLDCADLDNDNDVDAFDAYLLCKYLFEAAYLLPVQSGIPETPADPGISAHFDQYLVVDLADPEFLCSLELSTSPVDILHIYHNGAAFNRPFAQSFNPETETYGFAGYNTQSDSLFIELEENPQSFTLQYSLNGVPGSIFINTGNAGDDPSTPALSFGLEQNYPNPFNPATEIRFSLQTADRAVLNIYNVKGQLVKTMIDARLAAGRHSVVWDGRDASGQPVGSGVYFARLTSSTKSATRKMVLLK